MTLRIRGSQDDHRGYEIGPIARMRAWRLSVELCEYFRKRTITGVMTSRGRARSRAVLGIQDRFPRFVWTESSLRRAASRGVQVHRLVPGGSCSCIARVLKRRSRHLCQSFSLYWNVEFFSNSAPALGAS